MLKALLNTLLELDNSNTLRRDGDLDWHLANGGPRDADAVCVSIRGRTK